MPRLISTEDSNGLSDGDADDARELPPNRGRPGRVASVTFGRVVFLETDGTVATPLTRHPHVFHSCCAITKCNK